MNEDRAKYNQYVENINKMLKSENFYADFQKKLKVARPVIKLNRKKRAKKRPGYNRKIYKTRVAAENKEFNNFEDVKIKCSFLCKPVYTIDNNNSMSAEPPEFIGFAD